MPAPLVESAADMRRVLLAVALSALSAPASTRPWVPVRIVASMHPGRGSGDLTQSFSPVCLDAGDGFWEGGGPRNSRGIGTEVQSARARLRSAMCIRH